MHVESESARTIFLVAIEHYSPNQWPAYLDQVCGDNLELRRQVLLLLDAHAQLNNFMAQPAAGAAPTLDLPSSERVGGQIGRYKLLEQIGEGGMGIVYVAEQTEPVRRKVALKIIKPGMDTRQVIARFEAERQALAMMDHPNIAKVLDAGATDAGRPYFVMDLVRGLPITEFCDKSKATPRDRLEMFVTVCQAVQHAHQKGIIHRDLKPTNVLITLHDGTPVAKVIDFGVAKAINQELSPHTIYTAFSQILGTPLYMSPEQAELSGLDVDTRSDVYTLGVLLYELLTGSTPFDPQTIRQAGLDELRRIIREDEPPRPSQRISTLKAEALSTVSEKRSIDERRLSHLLRGELDWIVMKCLEKDRNRRYESASAFASDVKRYLNDEPVQACPPSVIYRLRKFVRRRKWMLTTAVLVALAIIMGTAVSVWQAVQATAARRLADDRLVLAEKERQRAVTNFQKSLELVERMLNRVGYDRDQFGTGLASAKGDAGAPVGQAAWAGEKVAKNESDEDRELWVRRNDTAPLISTQMQQLRRRLLTDVVEFYEDSLKHMGDDPNLRHQAASTYGRIGAIYELLGDATARDAARTKAKRLWGELHSQYPSQVEYTIELAILYNYFGWTSGSEQYHRQAAELLEPLLATHPDGYSVSGCSVRGILANTYRSIGSLQNNQGRRIEAERCIRRAIELCRDGSTWEQDVLASSRHNHACLLEQDGRMSDAIAAFAEAVAVRRRVVMEFDERPFYRAELANDLLHQGILLKKADRLHEAEDSIREALKHAEDVITASPYSVTNQYIRGRIHIALHELLCQTGRANEAVQLAAAMPGATFEELIARGDAYHAVREFEKALADYEAAHKLDPRNPSPVLRMGATSAAQRKFDKVIEFYGQALSLDPGNIQSFVGIADAQCDLGRFDDALATCQEAISRCPNHDDIWQRRARAYDGLGTYEKAAEDYTRTIAVHANFNPWFAHKRRGLAFFRLKRYDDALADIAKAVELKPRDLTNLTWIPASLIAECEDKRFPDRLVKLADRTIELLNGDPVGHWARVQLKDSLGMKEAARADFEQAIAKFKADSPSAKHLNNAAWFVAMSPYSEARHIELAVGWAESSVNLYPDDGGRWNTLGVVRYRSGAWESAIAALETSDNLQAASPWNLYYLSMAHCQLGHQEQAAHFYAKAEAAHRQLDSARQDWNRLQLEAKALLSGEKQTKSGDGH